MAAYHQVRCHIFFKNKEKPVRIKRILAGMLAAVTIIAGSIPASGVQAEAATNWSVY